MKETVESQVAVGMSFDSEKIASDVAIKYPDSISRPGAIFESDIWVKCCWQDEETGIAIPVSTN